jgi:hypothetical protein
MAARDAIAEDGPELSCMFFIALVVKNSPELAPFGVLFGVIVSS